MIKPSYCKINNFGDRLNQVLAENLFSPLLGKHFEPKNSSSLVHLYAIGSFLSTGFLSRLNTGDKAIVLGMGAGYGDLPVQQSFGLGRRFPVWIKNQLNLPLPADTLARGEYHRIYWVRGPLTARLLGLDPALAISDAAYLIRFTDEGKRVADLRRGGISFMPHYTAAVSSPGLKEICESVGIRYIDPRCGVDAILSAIGSSEVLMTEALHGAVVSDALRVPWIPLHSSDDVFEFKWLDFCASIHLDYAPSHLPISWKRAFYNGRNAVSLIKNLTTRIRSGLSRWAVRPKDTALALLTASARRPLLSSDQFIARIDQELPKRLQDLKRDVIESTLFTPKLS